MVMPVAVSLPIMPMPSAVCMPSTARKRPMPPAQGEGGRGRSRGGGIGEGPGLGLGLGLGLKRPIPPVVESLMQSGMACRHDASTMFGVRARHRAWTTRVSARVGVPVSPARLG